MDRAETLKIKNCLKSWHFSIDSKILLTTLSGNEKLLYITLCSYLSPSGDTCFPSIKRLTLQMSCSRATIFRTLLELEEKKIVIRHEQFGKAGQQIPTLYEVHEIPDEFFIQPEQQKPEKSSPDRGSQIETGWCQSETEGVSKRDGGSLKLRHNHLPIEHIPKEIKDTQPLMGLSAERGENGGNLLSDEKTETSGTGTNIPLPKYLNEVAEYFLLKTGRDTLTDTEAEILITLGEVHALPRINREISVAAERFKSQGKSLKLIRMEYIQKALKYQGSTKLTAKKSVKQKEHESEPETLGFTLDDVLRTYQLGGKEPEDLPVICKMYRLSDEETQKAFEACGVEFHSVKEAKSIASG